MFPNIFYNGIALQLLNCLAKSPNKNATNVTKSVCTPKQNIHIIPLIDITDRLL